MPDLNALKAVIDAEPANAARSDVERREWGYATGAFGAGQAGDSRVLVQRDVDWMEFWEWLSVTGYADVLASTAAGGGGISAAQRNAARLALVVIESGRDLEVSRAGVRDALSPLVPAIVTVANKNSLLALGQTMVSPFEAAGLGTVTLADLAAVRGL